MGSLLRCLLEILNKALKMSEIKLLFTPKIRGLSGLTKMVCKRMNY